MLAPILAALLLVPPGSGVDRSPRQPIDVLDYRFALELTDSSDVIVGQATIDLRLLAAGLEQVFLDLIHPDAARAGTGMRVTAVTVGDRPASYRQEQNRLIIALAAGPAAGDRLRIVVDYRGQPATGLIIAKNRHGDRSFFSDNWPDKSRHWLPVIDHISDKATAEFSVTAPGHYQVISNGIEIERTDLVGGRRRTVWRQSVPIAPWLFALGVARFAVQHVGWHRAIPISTWVFAADRDAGFYDFAVPTKAAMAFYEEWVGPYSYEKLANVQSNSVSGGMEAASSIFYSAGSVTGTRDPGWQNVIVHEVAHQWFGNAVTERDWDDVWLSEGFATYFTLLFVEHAQGRDRFVEGLRSSRASVLAFDQKNPAYRVVHDQLADMSQVTTGQTYQKGAWTLHMLRSLIGDDAFWAGIRDYYRRYRDGQASTADFRQVMEAASDRKLEWFFNQWLYRGGSPALAGAWRYDRVKKTVDLELTQTQPGDPFRLSMEVALRFPDGTHRTERIDLSDRRHRYTWPAAQDPARLDLDPNVRTLFSGSVARR